MIGGTDAADVNVVASYSLNGFAIVLNGPASTGNKLLGNRINMNLAATQLPRSPGGGIVLSNAPGNTVGGLTAAARNFIYGDYTGLLIAGIGSRQNAVLGNWFGLKADGTQLRTSADFPTTGIRVDGPENRIGGSDPGAGNVVAGGGFGILVGGNSNRVAGNFVGTDPTGKIAIRNSPGIYVSGNDNLIGGPAAGAGNLISGNGTGASLVGSNNVFQGNLVGTDLTGKSALPNGKINSGDSSVVVSGSHNLIGGTVPGARNVISGNDSAGVDLLGTGAQFNRVEGNWIGVAADGTSPLPNRHRGIEILGASHSIIGGEAPGAGNEIAYNAGAFYSGEGIFVALTFGGFGNAGTNNLIFGNHIHHNAANGVGMLAGATVRVNSIHDNGKLAIDRLLDGVTPNVPQGARNFPVITSARQGSTYVEGTFDGKPDTTYKLDFYNNPSNDPSKHGELENHLGTVVIRTDAKGKASYHTTFDRSSLVASWVSATATEIIDALGQETEGETSEAALNRVVDPPLAKPIADLAVTVSLSSVFLDRSGIVKFRVKLTNLGPDASDDALVVAQVPPYWTVISHQEPAGIAVRKIGPKLSNDVWSVGVGPLEVGGAIEVVFDVQATGLLGPVLFGAIIDDQVSEDRNLNNNRATQALIASLGPALTLRPPEPLGNNLGIEFPNHPAIHLQVAEGIFPATQPERWQMVMPGLITREGNIATYDFLLQAPGAPPIQIFRVIAGADPLPQAEVQQLSLDLDGVETPFSDWGTLTLHWKPTLEVTYLNAKIGENWSLRNIPLIPVDGLDVEQVLQIPFQLGTSGTSAIQVPLGLSWTPGLSASPRVTQVLVNVRQQDFRIHSGEQGNRIAYAPAVNPVGGQAGTPVRGKPGFPNREQGTNECAPAAILNSLQYLDLAFNLGLPKSELTIEKIKQAVQWNANGAPVGADPAKAEWVASKRAYMRPHGLPINTDETANIGIALNALSKCYDVELRVAGHVVCVRGIVPLPEGQYMILVSHDTDQGHVGGTVIEPWFYTPSTGKIIAPGWIPDFRQFVIEYPDGH